MYLNEFLDGLVTENHIANTLGAYALYEILKGVSNELSNIIFSGDTFYLPILNISINISKFMKHAFIFIFAILIIVIYKKYNDNNIENKENTENIPIKKGGKSSNKIIRKKVKFVKN